MSKHIKLIGTDDDNVNHIGYFDLLFVYESKKATKSIFQSQCRCDPNPFDPKTTETWSQVYIRVIADDYLWEVYQSPTKGKVLLLRNRMGGIEIATTGKKSTGEYIEIHAGGIGSKNPEWPGSKGCFTLPKTSFPSFIALFKQGEKGTLTLARAGNFDKIPKSTV